MKQIKIKRIYEAAEQDDGIRILIDRLWPRGIKKSEAKIDVWLKDIAPSQELRRFFGHEREKFSAFKQRYKAELKDKIELLNKLSDALNKGDITLLYSAKDKECNNAVVLREYLLERYGKEVSSNK